MARRNEATACACGNDGRGSFGWGVLTGLVAAGAAWIGRKVAMHAAINNGHTPMHRALDLASAAMQPKYPVEALSTYLNGLHFYADDMNRQVEAHHFCTHLAHDMHQCIIYDSNQPNARLIGIEYIISADRFRGLPEGEKRLWHSHHYEISSGQLVAPGIPELAERTYFKDLISTYGKTFHMWQVDRDDFPYGIPQLMMGFTADGQADPAKLRERDQRLGISWRHRRAQRSGIAVPEPLPGANAWETGRSLQTALQEVDLKGAR
ncbi:MAG: OBAP family protein, partial [Rhodospirillales bacterium]|nr:OBAP family protein [Rhodospirillales bacterium]